MDLVCLDCEDSVPSHRKQDARETIVRLLGELDFGGELGPGMVCFALMCLRAGTGLPRWMMVWGRIGRSEVAVRINALDTEHAKDDLRAIIEAEHHPTTLVVPKVDTTLQLEWVRTYMCNVTCAAVVTWSTC